MRLPDRLRQAYLVADLRSLALGRIGLAAVLIANLIMRALVLRDFYSNEGLLPNHTLLWRPEQWPVFSLLFVASTPAMAAAAFLLCGVAFLALLVGYRTRTAQVLSYLAVLSLNARSFFNGGDIVLCELALWSMFLPVGRRWSVDAALARRRGASSGDPGRQGNQIVAPAVAVLLAQLLFIYLLNALHKNGVTWRDGSAVHYVLHQDTIATSLGVWVRGFMTPNLSKILTWGTLAIEWTLPVLLASPIALQATRRAALLLAAGLHIGFVLFINLEMFTPAMIACLPFLLRGEDAAAFERWWMTRWSRLRTWPPLANAMHATSALLDAVAAMTPLPDPAATNAPIVARARRGVVLVRRAIFLALVALAVQRLVAGATDWRGPVWCEQAESYLMLHERWYMFAPEAPRTDMNVSVDAVTAEGRHVDPFNELASPGHQFPGHFIPPHLNQSPLFVEWALKVPFIPAYHQAFQEWVLRYPQRTGRPQDRIVSFRAYVVEDDSPPPGGRTPTNTRVTQFYEYTQ
jgi:HTTM domain